jgi:hypothetical protein
VSPVEMWTRNHARLKLTALCVASAFFTRCTEFTR